MWLEREDLQKEINYMMLGRRIFAYFNFLHPKKVKKIFKKKVKEQYRICIEFLPLNKILTKILFFTKLLSKDILKIHLNHF